MNELGNFTGLAENYSKYRPDYAGNVLTSILSQINKEVGDIDFVDVGAGTGIWTRMVAAKGCKSVTAVEPNDDMRSFGIQDSQNTGIIWQVGSGEATGLPDNSADLISMASSFHWVDFENGLKEFHRVLRPGGCFVALWNPRHIQANPMLVEIENKLSELAPEMERVSSGKAKSNDDLSERLAHSPLFDELLYLEGRHLRRQTPEEYIGVWNSVNDVRVQLGEERFAQFMAFVEEKVSGLEYIETTYLTRAWLVRRK